MCKLKTQTPIVRTPSFVEQTITSTELDEKLKALKVSMPLGLLDGQYYFTDLDGWLKIIWDLTFASSLYKASRFDCDNYAFKAMNQCAERYGLNTMAYVSGNSPQGYHAFNMVYTGDEFLLFEPNNGFTWSGQLFPFGINGYEPDTVLL